MFDCLRGLVAYSRGWGTGGRVIFSSSCASFWVSLGWDRNGDPTSVANALQNRNLVVSACFSHSFSIHISKLQDVAPSFFGNGPFKSAFFCYSCAVRKLGQSFIKFIFVLIIQAVLHSQNHMFLRVLTPVF